MTDALPPGDTPHLFPLVYDELKRIAHRHLRQMGGDASLCTTELVHEAYLKLARPPANGWADRAHFFGAASRAMRQILIDFARRAAAGKRGGGWCLVALDPGTAESLSLECDELLALDAALDRLDTVQPRLRQVVELRFFAGLPLPEIAETLGVSLRTVERDWLKARLLLLHDLGTADHPTR